MAEEIKTPMSDFDKVEQVKDSAEFILLQDGVNARVEAPIFEQKILNKIDDGFLRKTEKIPNENLTFGEVKQGDKNVVSGDNIIRDVFNIGNDTLNNLLLNKGKEFPFLNYTDKRFTAVKRFMKAILDVYVWANDNDSYNYSVRFVVTDTPSGHRIDVFKKNKENGKIEREQFRTIGGVDQTDENIAQLQKLKSRKIENIFLKSVSNNYTINIIIDTAELLESKEYIDLSTTDWDNFVISDTKCFELQSTDSLKKDIEKINELSKGNEKRIEVLEVSNEVLYKAISYENKKNSDEMLARLKYSNKIENEPDFEAPYYGIEWNENHTDPTRVTRIGHQDLHKSLPIQNKIRRCVVKNNVVQYYLDANNSELKANGEPAKLDGTDGDVMVEIPEFFYKAQEYGAGNSVKKLDISEWGIPGYLYSQKHYISAYECTVNRDTNVLSSVCTTNYNRVSKELFIKDSVYYIVSNESGHSLGIQELATIRDYTDNAKTYRGNVNDASLDNQLLPTDANYARNNLGRAITHINRRDAKKYANNGGKLIQQYDSQRALFMLIMVEYATRQIQDIIKPKSAEGYTQGGLGWGATKYPDYAGYEKFFSPQGGTAVIPIGITNSLGNKSGEVYFEIKNCPIRSEGVKEDAVILEYGNVYMPVMSYRGIENFYGHLYKIVDGLDTRITYERGSGGYYDNHYYYQPNPYLTNDTEDVSNYVDLGSHRIMSSIKVITKLMWGADGHIIPIDSHPDKKFKEFYCDCVEHIDEWGGNTRGAMKYLTYNGRAVSGDLVGLLFSVIAVDLESDRARTSDTVRLQMF